MLIKNIGAVISVLLVGSSWFFLFKKYFSALKARKNSLNKLEKNQKEIPLITHKATVLSKRTNIKYETNVKYPSHRLIYFITFSVDGTVLELEVPKDVFETVTENKTVTLVTSDGLFYSFD